VTIKDPFDYSYTGVDTIYWSLIEINTAIVCASVMTLKPLLNRMLAAPTKQPSGTPEDGSPGAHQQQLRLSLSIIRSRPAHKVAPRPPRLQTRHSWLSAQLAKLDRSFQTADGETRSPGDEEANLRRPETARERLRGETELSPWSPGSEAGGPAGRDRLSHNSSIITPVEQRADEGPLR
jgi:hypothetical protein